eukprot:g1480.t1
MDKDSKSSESCPHNSTTTTMSGSRKKRRTASLGQDKMIVQIDYEEISMGEKKDDDAAKIVDQKIEDAFGPKGLGIIAVTNVPGVAPLRSRLLPMGRKFALLPDAIKKKYEHPESLWSFGWSHGKEKLQGRPDFAKGSYYANPLENVPFDDPKIVEKWITFAHPNIWPKKDMPELEPAFMKLGKVVVDVGKLVSRECDRFVRKRTKDTSTISVFGTIEKSKVTKARLLHYFSRTKKDIANEKASTSTGDDAFSNWCGWHNDHGSLTGLVPAMYFDDATGNVIESGSPDKQAGLYLRSRQGVLVKAIPPRDVSNCLLFQIGETAQIHSGGILCATPHAVRGVCCPDVSRTTLAVFMEPNFDEIMRAPKDRRPESAQTSDAVSKLPKGVPPLNIRWGTTECPFTTCNFGTFTKETLKHYH